MPPSKRSHFLEKELRLILSSAASFSSAELAKRIQVTREEVLPLLQALLADRYIGCTQHEASVAYHLYSNAECAVLKALDEAQEPLPLHSIAPEVPRHEAARAVLALVQTGAITVSAGGDFPHYQSMPCRMLE